MYRYESFTIVIALSLLGTVTAGCSTNEDCELLGVCSSGSCKCAKGFTGEHCGQLDLLPANSATADGKAWPKQASGTGAASWGMSVVRGDGADNYHAIVNVGCGDTATKVTGTFAAILSSTEPDKNWTFTDAVTQPTSFNPHMIRAPNGTYLLYFRVNDLDAHPFCTGDPNVKSAPTPLIKVCGPGQSATTDNCLHAGSPDGPGINMYVAWADSLDGPWQASNVSITGCGNFHKSNPTTAFLKDGRVMLSYRFNYEGEMVAFATADDFRGPFKSIANLTHTHGNDEDSYLWQQPDGSLHILYHNGENGLHAFSDVSGTAWTKGSGDAFTLTYNTTAGTTVTVKRRERPEMLFDADGHPQYFFSAVETHEGNSFSLVQPFA